eukprot:1723651-Alexandrium_andersonii.AAC.1
MRCGRCVCALGLRVGLARPAPRGGRPPRVLSPSRVLPESSDFASAPSIAKACVHACMRACMRACVRACVHGRVRACARACVRACARACVGGRVRACVHE